jgi:hypothetical protein
LSTKARRPTTWTSKVARAPNIVRVGDDEVGPVAWVLPASDEREQAVWRGPMPGDGVSDDVERHGLYLAA